MTSSLRLSVLGAGSWGTALAVCVARKQPHCRLWGWQANEMDAMARARCNQTYLPAIKFPDNLIIDSKLAASCEQADVLLIAVPSHAFAELLGQIKPHSQHLRGIIWATKGLNPASHRFLSDVFVEHFPKLPFALLQGPSFAGEVAANLPTAITLASTYTDFQQTMQDYLHQPHFRVYTLSDIIGVQVGGAVKNVLAIAIGIADGLGLGANARAALITRGLHEMVQLGVSLGAESASLFGLAGLGDLVLTAGDNQSRNRRFGLLLGQGQTVSQAKAAIQQTIEGINTALEIHQLAKQVKVDMPICHQVYCMLHQQANVRDALDALLSRPSRAE